MKSPPIDHPARDRALSDFDTSLVIEAGAGTGKTTLLVERIHRLVCSGRARLDQVAAVTFTENAATTLKLRLRERFEVTRSQGHPGPESLRAAAALDVLEKAQVSTIHALAAAFLQERPIECGVVPGFRTADQAESDVLFARAFDDWLDQCLSHAAPALLEALDAGIALEGSGPWGDRASIRGLARELVDQRDLTPLVGRSRFDPTRAVRKLNPKAKLARQLATLASGRDPMVAALEAFGAAASALPAHDLAAFETALATLPPVPPQRGQQKNWPPEALRAARELGAWWKETRETWIAELAIARHARIVALLLGVVDHYERRKREAGVLDFLDLLSKAEKALSSHSSVRRYFRERFPFVLIDEFQDTDPLQVRLARLLSDGRPGGLVIVGDAKQSIYRFRRAEVDLFRRASEEAATTPGKVMLHLTQNFRSRPAILRFVNRVFSELLVASAETGQAAYEALAPPPDLPDQPAVVALSFEAPFAQGPTLLRAEAAALAAFVRTLARGGERVRDPGAGFLRPSRGGDVMVLSRRLTHVGQLEEALELQGVAFTVEGGRSFFDRQEVHEVLAVLRAIDDPADRVAVVAALRSSFFGVSDRELGAFLLGGGRLTSRENEETLEGAAAILPALGLLDGLRHRRRRESVPLLLERLYDETRVLAAVTGGRRGESQVANLEKVVALAREASRLGVLTLGGFVRLLAERVADGGDEADLPSTAPGDSDTVRILSIHRAKGLEAPVVALFDTADNQTSRITAVPLREDGRVALGFRPNAQPPGWNRLKEQEEKRVRAEGRRLLYVACTRPRDLLVVPVPPSDAETGSFWRELWTRLPDRSDGDTRVVRSADLEGPDPPSKHPSVEPQVTDVDPVAASFDAARQATLEFGGRLAAVPVSVTTAAARSAAPRVDSSTGGRGPAFGDLVHRLLLWGGEGTERWMAQASTAGADLGLGPDACAEAVGEVARVWAHPLLARARSARRVLREWPLAWLESGELLEGVVDLCFDEGDGLVLVDYKTDSVTAQSAKAQAAHHAPQLRLYARGLERATGLAVKERVVLFTALGLAVPV